MLFTTIFHEFEFHSREYFFVYLQGDDRIFILVSLSVVDLFDLASSFAEVQESEANLGKILRY